MLGLITGLLFALGLAGTVIPGLPGVTIIYAGILLYAFGTGFANLSVLTVIVFGVVTALAVLASLLGSAAGSRLGGGKRWALAGTIIGGVAGAFSGPAGLFAGAFLGALIGALIEGRQATDAAKVALFSVLGVLGGTLIQFLLGVALIVAFLIAIAV